MAGRYRLRTTLRERLPEALTALVPKGADDCGNHEWYKAENRTWRCYHCIPGETHEVPWDDREIAARRHELAAVKIRGGLDHPGQHRTAH
jgi:hypothetical protein